MAGLGDACEDFLMFDMQEIPRMGMFVTDDGEFAVPVVA